MRTGLISVLFLTLTLSGFARSASEQERNKHVARNFFEDVLGQGRLDKYPESHAKDFVAHGASRDFTLDEDMAFARDERQALPDMSITVKQMIAEGDRVAVYWTAAGTNTHAGMGFPATGNKIKVSGMTLFRFQDGKIREEWGVWDELSAMKQAGLFPSQP